MTTPRIVAGVLLAFMAISASVFAAGGTGKYTLPWNVKGQVLEYHSCGCADACWIAEVRNTQTKTVVARLRCDCEQLYFSTKGQTQEQKIPQACAQLENKPEFIRQTLNELLVRKMN
jgi:hypothetical protein